MARRTVRLAVTVAAAALAVTGLSSSALADTATTTTAPAGNLVVNESTTFLQNAANAGIVALALPTATPGYSATTGFNATFPVTGGTADLAAFNGSVQLGGGLLLVNINTGATVVFTNLTFDASHYAVEGTPLGQTTPVKLLDTVRVTVTKDATTGTQTLNSAFLALDTQGAAYADTTLNTTFFTAHANVGTAVLTYTPAG
ncbi:hypothetical protein ACFW1A_39450 [Kitasatospora sp. NPDC058965]|uniref:hypothetical protein n=1 Tax=Kitasatospora sp. NPDC058965 TaxID=3346682 RepID=UPI0036C811AA